MIFSRGLGQYNIPSPSGYTDFSTYKSYVLGLNPQFAACGNPTTCPDISGFQTLAQDILQAWQAQNAPGGSITQAVAAQNAALNPTLSFSSSGAQNAPGGNPVVSFNPSRSGGVLQPGDTWTVSITGGSPNTVVSVTNNGKSGTVGKTDANGNFTLAGSVLANQVGSYTESWFVGGTPAGTFSFSVVSPSSGGGGGGTSSSGGGGSSNTGGTGGGAPPPAQQPLATPPSACSLALFGETSCIGPIGTTTAVVAAALVLVLVMMGGKR
jgi:hypothetical protein